MRDDPELGAVPVDDAVIEDPPTEADVLAAQERNSPEQASTRMGGGGLDRHPDADDEPSDTGVQAERQAEGEAAERRHE